MDNEKLLHDLDALDHLAEEFTSSRREGNEPSVEAFATDHPDLADGIRSLFPIVNLLEHNKPSLSEQKVAEQAGQPLATRILPDQLGGCRLVHELGRGGMGIVFEALQQPLDRRVAVKILPTSLLQDDRTRRRFLREAQAIARLRHPHIASIHEFGEEAGVLYYVMDLVDGASLDQLISREETGTTARERACWVAGLGIQAAQALAYAHDQGVLHRDVKPANLLLDQDGVLWLTDFGLAKLIDEQPLTITGEWLGTLRYLAPECLRGEASIRSDIYSLGLTLYELLVGVPAFPQTDRPSLIRQISESVPIPPRKHDPTIPSNLETVVLKASAREPADRYGTASELAEDLERFLEGRAIKGRRTGPLRQLARRARRHPAVAILSLTTIVLALAIALLIGRYVFRAPQSAASIGPPSQTAVVPSTPQPVRNGPPWGPGYGRFQAGGRRGRGGPWRNSTQ
ncbi:MAG: serine/threonine-protein kinase [Isosphaeraceae bacterium]